jgi:hypothetical protein
MHERLLLKRDTAAPDIAVARLRNGSSGLLPCYSLQAAI